MTIEERRIRNNEAMKRYYLKNKAKQKAKTKEWRKKNNDKHKASLIRHYEKYKNDPAYIERRKAWHKKYYENNKEMIIEKGIKRCKAYRESFKDNKDILSLKDRKAEYRSKYGLTIEDYDKMLINQNNKCAICGSTETGNKKTKYFSIDHDHTTGKIRDLLCSHCNNLLGRAHDNIETLRNAIKYLEKHNTITEDYII